MLRKTLVVAIILLVHVLEQTNGVALDGTCAVPADCTGTTPNSDCTGTTSKTCTCATGYTKQVTACKANLGTVCTATTDCDTTTTADAVCDLNAATKICSVGSAGSCAGDKSTKCLSRSTCVSDVCTCSAGYTATAGKLCAPTLGTACTNTADCTTITPNSECPATGTKLCTCATGYTKVATACKANLGTACTATTDCDTTTTSDAVCDLNAATKICSVGSGGSCAGDKSTKCLTYSTCVSDKCTCSAGYTATTSKLCSGADGMVNAISTILMLASFLATFKI